MNRYPGQVLQIKADSTVFSATYGPITFPGKGKWP